MGVPVHTEQDKSHAMQLGADKKVAAGQGL
jgi:hypothetical protein